MCSVGVAGLQGGVQRPLTPCGRSQRAWGPWGVGEWVSKKALPPDYLCLQAACFITEDIFYTASCNIFLSQS